MMMKSALVFLCFTVFTVYGQNLAPGACPNVTEPSGDFELSRYLGTWYEIARTANIWEIGLRCVTANYSLSDDGNIRVENKGVNPKGRAAKAIGTARRSEIVNLLRVKFSRFSPEAPYWVPETDFDTYAIVVSCVDVFDFFKFESAWILAREPTLPEETKEKLLNDLEKKYGIAKKDMQLVDQTKCPQ